MKPVSFCPVGRAKRKLTAYIVSAIEFCDRTMPVCATRSSDGGMRRVRQTVVGSDHSVGILRQMEEPSSFLSVRKIQTEIEDHHRVGNRILLQEHAGLSNKLFKWRKAPTTSADCGLGPVCGNSSRNGGTKKILFRSKEQKRNGG